MDEIAPFPNELPDWKKPRIDQGITTKQRTALFELLKCSFGPAADCVFKEILGEFGLTCTKEMTFSVYAQVMDRIRAKKGTI